MRAVSLLREKRLLLNLSTGTFAIAELKIWGVPRSKDYPTGRKFSLFLVHDGEVIVGIDNHKPKGPHLHLGENELPYLFHGEERLVTDFWDLCGKAGFES